MRNLICNESRSASELSFSWNSPAQLEEEVTGYRVEVKELQEDPDTKDVTSVIIADFNTTSKWALVDQGLGKRYEVVLSVSSLVLL